MNARPSQFRLFALARATGPLVACVLAALAGAAQDRAQPSRAGAQAPPIDRPAPRALLERELITTRLESRLVSILGMSATELIVRDPQTGTRRLPIAEVVALVPPRVGEVGTARDELGQNPEATGTRGPAESRPIPLSLRATVLGELILTDGQVFPGGLAPVLAPALASGSALSEADDQTGEGALGWSSPMLGSLALSLEQLASVSVIGAPPPAPRGPMAQASRDRLMLRNGDRVEGFLELRADTPGVLRLEAPPDRPGLGASRISEIPLARVASIWLANPPRRSEGLWIWLADGTAMRVDSVTIPERTAQATTGGQSAWIRGQLAGRSARLDMSIDAAGLRAVAWGRERVAALAQLPLRKQPSSLTPRYWTPPPIVGDARRAVLGAADIEVPGPMRLVWSLPQGAQRVAAGLELPESSRVWGHCTVIVRDGQDRELWSATLTPEEPQASFNLTLPAGTTSLTLEVDEGENGPVEDRVLIRRGLVLMSPQARGSADPQ